jgi:hypothetical protein
MINLPTKLPAPAHTKHETIYDTVNQLIDYLAEREPQPPKKRSIWDLKTGSKEKYWALDSVGDISQFTFDSYTDESIRNCGSAFLTREEAEAELQGRRERAKML